MFSRELGSVRSRSQASQTLPGVRRREAVVLMQSRCWSVAAGAINQKRVSSCGVEQIRRHRPSGNGKSRRMSIGEGSEEGHDELGVPPQHEVAQEGRRVRHF